MKAPLVTGLFRERGERTVKENDMFKGQEYRDHLEEFVKDRALESDPSMAVRVFDIDSDDELLEHEESCNKSDAWCEMSRKREERWPLKRKRKTHPLSEYLSGDALKNRVEYHNARARRRSLPATLTVGEWLRIVLAYKSQCAYCGSADCLLEIEHVVPIDLGGGTELSNIVPACEQCNSSKRVQCPAEWKKGSGYLEAFVARRKLADAILKIKRPTG